jgi:hypothetical protein
LAADIVEAYKRRLSAPGAAIELGETDAALSSEQLPAPPFPFAVSAPAAAALRYQQTAYGPQRALR